MNQKEASARIKINKLLDESGWRFLNSEREKNNPTLLTIANLAKALKVPVDVLFK